MGRSSVNILTSNPLIFIMIHSPFSFLSISTCINALGKSAIMTLRHCFASIVAVIITDSVMVVGLAASSLSIYSHWELPLAQAQPIMLLSLLPTKKIRLSIVRRFSSPVNSSTLPSSTTTVLCIVSCTYMQHPFLSCQISWELLLSCMIEQSDMFLCWETSRWYITHLSREIRHFSKFRTYEC